MSRYAIGDLHGCYHSFEKLLSKIGLNNDDELFLIGDLVDRGPYSRQIIDKVFDLQNSGIRVEVLRGNHEEIMIKSMKSKAYFNHWKKWGGKETMESFEEKKPKDISKKYRKFLKSLPYFIELDDFVLVHASLNFEIPNFRDDLHSMLFSRTHSHDKKQIGRRIILHGHTPLSKKDIKAQLDKSKVKVINLDGGCVYQGMKNGKGYLFALDMNNMQFYSCKKSKHDIVSYKP